MLAGLAGLSPSLAHGLRAVRAASAPASEQEPTEYGVKAICMARFASNYVKWPEKGFRDKTSPFVLAVFGKDPFGKSLELAFKGQKVGTHAVKIDNYADLDELDEDCKLLFVPEDYEKHLKRIVEFYKGKPILIIAESIAAAQSGAHIGFYLEDSRVRFAINQVAAKRARLEISSELLKLAKVVEDKQDSGR